MKTKLVTLTPSTFWKGGKEGLLRVSLQVQANIQEFLDSALRDKTSGVCIHGVTVRFAHMVP